MHRFEPPEPGVLDWHGAERGLESESDEPPESFERGCLGTCCAPTSDVDAGAAITALVTPGPATANNATKTRDATMQARRLPAGNAVAA